MGSRSVGFSSMGRSGSRRRRSHTSSVAPDDALPISITARDAQPPGQERRAYQPRRRARVYYAAGDTAKLDLQQRHGGRSAVPGRFVRCFAKIHPIAFQQWAALTAREQLIIVSATPFGESQDAVRLNEACADVHLPGYRVSLRLHRGRSLTRTNSAGTPVAPRLARNS